MRPFRIISASFWYFDGAFDSSNSYLLLWNKKKCLEGTMINPNPWAFCYWASYAISSFEWIPRIYFLHYFWDFTGTKHNLWCAVRSQVPSDWCAFRIGENIGTQFLGKTCPLLSSNTMWESHAFSDNSQSTIVLPELPGNLIQKYHRRWR